MADNREYLTRAEENGSINIAEDVVAAIAADAIGEIEGVGSMCQNNRSPSSSRAKRACAACAPRSRTARSSSTST